MPEERREPAPAGDAPPGGRQSSGEDRPTAAGARLVRTVARLREVRAEARERGQVVALVPTMGYLHEGHLGLVDRAKEEADLVVLSVFVNPVQFGPEEDYQEYPRDLDRDLVLASDRGVDVVFAPPEEEMYPVPQTIWVEPGELAERLCGAGRPGHFRGVLTVVMKLFAIVEPEVAVFGQKDFQQSVLVRRMTEELRLPVRVEVGPTVRAEDGLALSSRNAYLDEAERLAASAVPEALRHVRKAFHAGMDDAETLAAVARRFLEEGGVRMEYVEIVDPEELTAVVRATPDAVCAIAGRVGETRLIDNAALGGASELDRMPAGAPDPVGRITS